MRLADYLQEKKLTVEAFGALIGRSHTSVVRYVSGERTPGRSTMERIVSATEGRVTPNDFYSTAQPEEALPAGDCGAAEPPRAA